MSRDRIEEQRWWALWMHDVDEFCGDGRRISVPRSNRCEACGKPAVEEALKGGRCGGCRFPQIPRKRATR